jgi:hypothetical protein
MTHTTTASRQQVLLTGDAPVHFDGKTYDPRLDLSRLTTQLERVRGLMLHNGDWWTLPMLQQAIRLTWGVRASEASISARIRDLRKDKFGGHVVLHRRRGDGLWEYRLVSQEVAR